MGANNEGLSGNARPRTHFPVILFMQFPC